MKLHKGRTEAVVRRKIAELGGSYLRYHHTQLIRENRLIAGVYTLSELETKMRQRCLLMEKQARGCTYDDACTLAQYAGLVPHTDGHDTFIKEAMGLL